MNEVKIRWKKVAKEDEKKTKDGNNNNRKKGQNTTTRSCLHKNFQTTNRMKRTCQSIGREQ